MTRLATPRKPDIILACDCILRRVEAEQKQMTTGLSRILSAFRVRGFSTYGEQINTMHVNQTLTGVAIYPPEGEAQMDTDLIDPRDPPERQNAKLRTIVTTLMRRLEQSADTPVAAYDLFQRSVTLEQEVRLRTRELERALDLLNESNTRLSQARAEAETARTNLANAIETVQEGFAMFDADERMVLCNSRFGKHMRDIHHLFEPGLHFEEYVRLVANSPYLSLPDGETPERWAAYRMARHRDDRAVFNARMAGSRWLQVSEQRTPDGGTVVLQTDITDMIRLEREERERLLDDQARLVKATLEHLDQGVCIFDDQNRLVGWNGRAGELLNITATRFRLGAPFATLYDLIRDSARFSGRIGPDDVEAWIGGAHAPRRSRSRWSWAGDARSSCSRNACPMAGS